MTTDTLPRAATRALVGAVDHLDALRAVVVSPSAHAELAGAYAALPAWDDAAVPAYAAFVHELRHQADILRAHGLRFIVQDTDPYASPADMIADVARGTIRVLATETTGAHPYLTDADNDLFRAVHDVLGHAATGRGFDRHGEEAAYRAHAAVFSPLARGALATETRGQNAALIATGAFQDQKVAVLPQCWQAAGALSPRTDAERALARVQARTFHEAGGLSWGAR